MELITRTIYGALVQTALMTNQPHQYPEFTTLNEKFNIQNGVIPTAQERPVLNLLVAGIGAHRYITGADNRILLDHHQHRATDAALFEHIPLVLRLPANDLTPTQRQGYALRKEVPVGPVTYIGYYAKRLDLTNLAINAFIRTVINGTVSNDPFVADQSNLNPVPPDLSPTGINLLEGRYAVTSAIVEASFNEFEIEELLNVGRILFDDERAIAISELGLCTGVDRVISIGAANFRESIGVQIASHIAAFFSPLFNNELFRKRIELGIVEPLFKLTPEQQQP